MERNITIIVLALSIAGLGYLKMEQLERHAAAEVAAEATAVEAAEAAAEAGAQAAVEAAKFHFTIPHDSETSTDEIVVYMNGTSSNDADADSLAFYWQQLDGESVQLETDDGIMTSFSAAPGEYTFQLTVTDTYGDQASKEATVAVQPEPNRTPEVAIEVFTED